MSKAKQANLRKHYEELMRKYQQKKEIEIQLKKNEVTKHGRNN